jgi:hypothetical protein
MFSSIFGHHFVTVEISCNSYDLYKKEERPIFEYAFSFVVVKNFSMRIC